MPIVFRDQRRISLPEPALPAVLITGATGRVGTLLRAAWAARVPTRFRPVWQTRLQDVPGWVMWDMLHRPCPHIDPPPRAARWKMSVFVPGKSCTKNC